MSEYDGLKALQGVKDEIEKIRKKFGLYKEISGGEEFPLAEDKLNDIRAKLREAITAEVERE